MNYYLVYPEIAGELGEASEVIYECGRIREVTFLEYKFMGWQGDELLSTHPCFIVTSSLKNDIKSNGFRRALKKCLYKSRQIILKRKTAKEIVFREFLRCFYPYSNRIFLILHLLI